MLRDSLTSAAQKRRIRDAAPSDVEAIRSILNEAVEDHVATLDVEAKTADEMRRWYAEHDERYAILVALEDDTVMGWAALNRYSHRCAYDLVADLSVYVRRDKRGTGVGTELLTELERVARQNRFHKVVLFAFPTNKAGRRLYLKSGFSDVGTFREQGVLDGKYIDVIAMEKILR
ncbi:MAG: N-acetyltransferase [Candidatus Eremiobacteraeota bacterium]|nr:N-acetyltransferase [Candidatus Eremiobacteraeota bacterium]